MLRGHSWVWKDVLSFLSGKKTQRRSYSKTLKCTLLSKSTSQSTLRSLKTVWCVRSDKFVHLANLKTESQSRGIVNSWLTFHMKKAHFVMFIREKDIIFDSPFFIFLYCARPFTSECFFIEWHLSAVIKYIIKLSQKINFPRVCLKKPNRIRIVATQLVYAISIDSNLT